jgi:hypothetical protein
LLLKKTDKDISMQKQIFQSVTLANLIVLLAIIIFILLAGHHIHMPGIYYDEITFVNAALGGVDEHSFSYRTLFGVPIMMMPYIGVLKSFLYYPIFKLFGISVVTIRLPVIFISAASLWLWYKIGRELLPNRLYPILLVIILAADPAFIFQSKFDWGPIVIQIFLMTLVIYLFIKIIKTNKVKLLWPLFGCLLLGIYNKLNFVWFVLAFGSAVFIFYAKNIAQLYLADRNTFIKASLMFVLLFLVAFLFLIIPSLSIKIGSSDMHFVAKAGQILSLYKATMNGSAVYGYVIGRELNFISWINYCSFIVFLVWLFVVIILNNKKYSFLKVTDKHTLFFLTIFVLVFMQIIFTKQAGGPHHIMMLWPLPSLLIFLMLYRVVLAIQCPGWFRNLLFVSPLCVLFFSQVLAVVDYEKAFNANSSVAYQWSPKIYQLANYINAHNAEVDYVISVNWGTGTQLFAFAQNNIMRKKYMDIWSKFTEFNTFTDKQKIDFYREYFHDKKNLVALYAKQSPLTSQARDNFFVFAKRYLHSYKLINVINDERGKPLFDVYLVTG